MGNRELIEAHSDAIASLSTTRDRMARRMEASRIEDVRVAYAEEIQFLDVQIEDAKATLARLERLSS